MPPILLRRRHLQLALALTLVALRPSQADAIVASASAPAPVTTLATIEVSGATEGFRVAPSHSYQADPDALAAGSFQGFASILEEQLPGVTLTTEQGNPLQPTLRFDGFTASPLLGNNQDLSVILDGARVNEPFGDVVNWDLIPSNALISTKLVPISDPVYGLNTLGGSLVLRTADGFSEPGGKAELTAGSFGRVGEQVRFGASHGDWGYFLAASKLHEGGWAPYSASRNQTFFGKVTRKADGNVFDLSYQFAQSALAGSQTLPQSWLGTPTAVYTAPDTFANLLDAFNLGDTQKLGGHLQLALHLVQRNSSQQSLNSNVNNNYDGTAPTPANPDATNVAADLQQLGREFSVALRDDRPLAGMANVASVGVEVDTQRITYTQVQQAATFTSTHYTVGIGPFDRSPVDLAVNNLYRGIYFTDALKPTRWLRTDLGGRFQQAHIAMTDLRGGALGGDHAYSRFNPSAGVDLHPDARHSYYLRYAEGMRAPMPVELTCASPSAPCSLPNVFVADPDLKPVVARSTQLGTVWKGGGVRAQAQFTDTRLSDAIQFISQPDMTQGYFTNVGGEDYRSLDLALNGDAGRLQWSASLTHTDAVYRSAFLEQSAANSAADSRGNIAVRPGDRIPNVPQWTLKLGGEFQASDALQVGARMRAYSGVYAQGNENNQDANGRIPGYAVFDLDAHYQSERGMSLGLEVDNLFNRVYSTYGILGTNEFTAPGRGFNPDPAGWQTTQFVGVGAPRGVWLTLGYSWS